MRQICVQSIIPLFLRPSCSQKEPAKKRPRVIVIRAQQIEVNNIQQPYSKSYVGKKSQQGSCGQQSHWTTVTKIMYVLLWHRAFLEQGSSHTISILLAQSALLCCMIALCDHLSHSQKGRVFFFITGFFESFSIRNKKKQKHHRCGSPAARFPHQWPLGPVIQRKNINGDLQFIKAWPPSPSSNGCLFPVAQLIHGIGIASLVSVNRRGSWTLIFSSESILMARPRFGLLSVNVTGNLITKTFQKKNPFSDVSCSAKCFIICKPYTLIC